MLERSEGMTEVPGKDSKGDHATDEGAAPPEPASLRFLRRLVTVLTGVMILAMVILIGLFLTRFPAPSTTPALPTNLEMPEGATAQAVTFGTGWTAVVTQDDRILIFSSDSGALRQEIDVDMPE